MSRFSKCFRDGFANRICRHFDKYCEITTPVKFNALEDIYHPVFSRKEWIALHRLMGTALGRKCLSTGSSFDLYLGNPADMHHTRPHICFGFGDNHRRPDIDIEYETLGTDVKEKIDGWIRRIKSLKKLRGQLYRRCDSLLDWGWESQRHYGNFSWRGGPEPGQGCNTPGQLNRIWPELVAFLPADEIACIRNAHVKSRMPKFIVDYGTIEQFRCEAPWYHDGCIDTDSDTYERVSDDKYTDEEMAYEKRIFDALTSILVQMSLMRDVSHVADYPTYHGTFF